VLDDSLVDAGSFEVLELQEQCLAVLDDSLVDAGSLMQILYAFGSSVIDPYRQWSSD
jgi:hypothetical protein